MSPNIELLKKLEAFRHTVIQALPEIEENDIATKSVLRCYLCDPNSSYASNSILVDAVYDRMKERINVGSWKDVAPYIRKTITITSYVRLLRHVKSSIELTDDDIKKAYSLIDSGIMFGCPIDKEPQLLQNCAYTMKSTIQPETSSTNETIEEVTIDIDAKQFNATPIKVIDCPSMEDFYTNYILTETPVILDNCMNHWPALTNWKKTNYLKDGFGYRIVAVEVGSSYTDEDWTQKVMTLGEFIKTYIESDSGPKGYVAQYQLFDQLPDLKKDIRVPDYCCFTDTNESVDINAWYGPKGTVSPLHHDPKRNLLAQVVGAKQLFLFSPKDNANLYPHEGEFLDNTSQVDPRKPDMEEFPKYKDATPYYCVLKSGQMLYIPPKWWHFVESLSLSFSVSFWWQ